VSAPFPVLVEHMMRSSDNVLAEALAREVALVRGGDPTFDGAAEQTLEALRQAGFDPSGVVLEDGSGLSKLDRVPARLLGELVAAAAAPAEGEDDVEFLRPIITGLPVAGGDGTLDDRFGTASDAAAGRGTVRAKTGTLTGVSSLAGVVVDADGAAARVRADVQRCEPGHGAARPGRRRGGAGGLRLPLTARRRPAFRSVGRVPSAVTTATGLPVDWELAARTAGRLTPPGPTVTLPEAIELVERLRTDAAVAEGHVREVTGLGAGLPLLPADVVDRPAWASAAVAGMRALTADARLPATPRLARAVTARTAGLQIGGVLAYLGGRVLGQYDPFGGADGEGRLLLVAPNVHAAQQALDVPSTDFGLWVCLHEATHRLQFTAVPWLREHFAGEVGRLLSLGEPAGLAERLPDALRALRESRGDALALVEVLQGPSSGPCSTGCSP
jgi:hypothetical protein